MTMSVSRRASPGGSAAWLILITRPSKLVVVPSSSHHTDPGRTTSARSAVSDMKKSITTRGSSLVDLDHAAFQVGGSPLVLTPHGSGQDDVCPLCGLRHEEINHDEGI